MPKPAHRTGPNADLLQQGLRLHQTGRPAEAAQLYQRVLQAEPDNPAANHLLGLIRLQAGDADAAVTLISRALRTQKSDPQYFANLGVAFNAAGRPKQALESFDRALALKPDFAEAHSNRGMALKSLQRFADAAESYRAAIRLRLTEAGFHLNLANALADEGEFKLAEASYGAALRLRPAYPAAHIGLAQLLSTLGRHEEALAAAGQAIAGTPDNADLQFGAASVAANAGRLEVGAARYRRAIALRPDYAEAHRMLSLIVRHRGRDSEILAMERIVADAAAPDEARLQAGFGLGKALGDIGEYQNAFRVFSAANALKRAHLQFSLARAVSDLEALQRPFLSVPKRLLDAGHREASPIFIVGLPRAGKTTLEGMLGRHAAVRGLGELPILRKLVLAFDTQTGIVAKPDALSDLPVDALARLGAAYDDVTRGLVPAGIRTIDTMPPNFHLIGFIRLALPNARILHCVRDPLDHCAAIFERFFDRSGYEFAYDLDELSAYYRAYQGVMAGWHRLFPGFVHDVDVAALRAAPEPKVREILGFCGLQSDPACAAFGESEPQLGDDPFASDALRRREHLAPYATRLAALLA